MAAGMATDILRGFFLRGLSGHGRDLAAALRITDRLEGVAPQIPARRVAEMWHQRVDAGLYNRGSNRVLYLIPMVHGGVHTIHFHVFHWPPLEAYPDVFGGID